MDHLLFLVLALPAMTCLNWVIFHCVYAFRVDTFRTTVLLLADCCVLMMMDAIFDAPGVSLHTLAWTNLLAQLTAPSIIPLAWLYLEKLRKGRHDHSPLHTAWVIAPVALFTGGVLLYSLTTPDEIEILLQSTYENGWKEISAFRGTIPYFYYIWTFIAFRVVLIIESILLLGYVVVVFLKEKMSFKRFNHFLFKKGTISVQELQLFNIVVQLFICPLKLLPMKRFIDNHPGTTILVDVVLMTLMAGFGMVALLGAMKEVTLKDIVNCLRFNYGTEDKEDFLRYRTDTLLSQASTETRRYMRERLNQLEEALQPNANTASGEGPTISERLFSSTAATWTTDSLQSEFDHLMTDEKLFLNPKLRLEDVAERLHTNKTYVSRMVNKTYDMSFSELINIMRIDYAEHFIRKNRTAKQAEIAEASGFISASAFNNVFKKITGITPKTWISQFDRANET